MTKIKILGLLLVGLIVCQAMKGQQRPNILCITIEDTSPQFIGCYGNSDARTPVIDQLAAEGVKFTNAFSTGTVCSPSRTAIISGVKTYKTGTGNHRSAYPLPDFIKGFPYYMQQQGYYTTNNKKTDYNIKKAKDFIAEAWSESSGKAGWWNRKAGQPFFAVFNFMDSHQSRTMTNPYSWYKKNVLDQLNAEERIGPNDFEMPPIYKDSPAMRKQMARVYNALKLTDNKIGQLLHRLERDGLKDSTIIFFFADHGEGMPRGKTNGIAMGYQVPFIVWVPEMYQGLSPWGTGGVEVNELVSFEDVAPTMVALAGGVVPEHLKGRVLMGPKRSPKAKYLFLSSDRSDNGMDMVRSVTDGTYMYSRNFMPFMPELRYINYMEIGEIKQLMRADFAKGELDTHQAKLFAPRPGEFLFKIDEDSWELTNLANLPSANKELKKFRNLVEDEMVKSKDLGLLPEYELAKISETAIPYVFRTDATIFPVDRIANEAFMCGFKGAKVIKKQVKGLCDEQSVVRYWAALGLRNQTKVSLESYKYQLKKGLTDAYAPVALTMAAICYDYWQDEQAELLLVSAITGSNKELALMGINYLLYMKHKEAFSDSVQKARELHVAYYPIVAACDDFKISMNSK